MCVVCVLCVCVCVCVCCVLCVCVCVCVCMCVSCVHACVHVCLYACILYVYNGIKSTNRCSNLLLIKYVRMYVVGCGNLQYHCSGWISVHETLCQVCYRITGNNGGHFILVV